MPPMNKERLSVFEESLFEVKAMVEKQSESGRDAQLAMLLHHKWQGEIERVVDKVKLGIIRAKKRTKTDQWFRKQWYRALAASKKYERRVSKR